MALKLIKFTPFKDSREIWHIFTGQRWEEAPDGSRYFQHLFLDTKCQRATYPTDPKIKGKFEFAMYDKKLHLKNMCRDCLKELKKELPIPVHRFKGFRGARR